MVASLSSADNYPGYRPRSRKSRSGVLECPVWKLAKRIANGAELKAHRLERMPGWVTAAEEQETKRNRTQTSAQVCKQCALTGAPHLVFQKLLFGPATLILVIPIFIINNWHRNSYGSLLLTRLLLCTRVPPITKAAVGTAGPGTPRSCYSFLHQLPSEMCTRVPGYP
eukprot:3658141-Rhodomonas_salina.1